MSNPLPRLTAAEAASLINDGDTIAFSGFTPAGAPKVVPFALAERAKALHAEGKPFKVGQEVKAGEQVATLEAMKMNTFINAPADGKVAEILVTVGTAVQEGQGLIRIE